MRRDTGVPHQQSSAHFQVERLQSETGAASAVPVVHHGDKFGIGNSFILLSYTVSKGLASGSVVAIGSIRGFPASRLLLKLESRPGDLEKVPLSPRVVEAALASSPIHKIYGYIHKYLTKWQIIQTPR